MIIQNSFKSVQTAVTILVLSAILTVGMITGGAWLSGCTANQRAKQFGGTVKIQLPCGQKLSFATWKDANLWYAIRAFRPGETPEVTTMIEDSDYGVMKGRVVFEECP
jgi:hypothetical protein